MSTCRTCKKDRRAEDFYASTPGECKNCRNARTAAARLADPDATRRYAFEAWRRRMPSREGRVCQACGKAIPVERNARAKYCSRQCAVNVHEQRRKRATEAGRAGRLCERCGDAIPVTRTLSAKTCSTKCRDALNERALMHRKCRALSNYAVKVGRLVRQPCELCGSPDIEMHHVDYFEPLNVQWLCFLHHRTVAHGQRVREESR